MAEHVVWLGVDVLVGKALSLAAEDFGSLGLNPNLKDDLQKLAEKLENIQSLATDAESKAASCDAVRDWLKNVIAVADEADDALDKCEQDVARLQTEIEVKKRSNVRRFLSPSNSFLVWYRMNRRILGRNLMLERVHNKSHDLELSPAETVTMSAKELEQTCRVDPSAIVSQLILEGSDATSAIEFLIDFGNEEDLLVQSLVGEGGIGKTSLARVAYKNVKVVNHFDKRIWVRVSQNFDVDRILSDMFNSLTRSRPLSEGSSSSGAILYQLLEKLKGKKYLLVLDDVPNIQVSLWHSLKECLLKIGGSRGSKVLVTSRWQDVASMLSETSKPFVTTYEEHGYSMRLMKQIASAKGGVTWDDQMNEIGEKIAETICGCIPLLSRLMAGLMYSPKYMQDLRNFDKLFSYGENPAIQVVRYCFNHLPSWSLKRCLAYCSIFPRDCVMGRDELIQLWMAQGFLYPPKGSDLDMKDVGSKYLDILVRCSFLQIAEEDELENRPSYMMHGIVKEVVSEISRGLYSVVENELVNGHLDAVHLSLMKCTIRMSVTLADRFKGLKTLRLVNTSVGSSTLEEIFSCAMCLRVLIVVDELVNALPNSVGNLKHLRYLDISRTRIVSLPDSTARLFNLQTLRLYDLQKVPKEIVNLVNLRHFYVENFKGCIEKLVSLPDEFQEMIRRSSFKPTFKERLVKETPIDQLGQEDKYASVKIYGLENVRIGKEASKANLSRMSKIDSLSLHWNARRGNYYDEDVLEGLEPNSNIKDLTVENFKGSKFPSWMVELRNLVKIELEGCCCCEQIPSLGHLSFLKIIRILGMNNVKRIGTEFYGVHVIRSHPSSSSSRTVFFRALRELTLKDMTTLEEWSEDEDFKLSYSEAEVFPSLEKLEIERCPQLTRLPDTLIIRGCKYLRRLEVSLCDKLDHFPEAMGRLEFLEDLEMRGLPFPSLLYNWFSSKLKSLAIGGFSGASKENDNNQHASASASVCSSSSASPSASLPAQLKQLSNLRSLTIWGYSGLEVLPEWLGDLKALQILKLEQCGNLKYLPSSQSFQKLTNLAELNICFCPLLEERCTRGGRQEWHKISYIPTIKISYETIKSPV